MVRRERRGMYVSAVLVVAVAAAAALAAASPSSGRSRQAAVPATLAKVKLPRKTIGILGPLNAAEVIKLGVDAANASAKSLGWKTITVDAQGDPGKMSAGMLSLVNAKVNAIVLVTMEPATIQQGLQAAKKAGIPVIQTEIQGTPSPLFAANYVVDQRKGINLLLDRMESDLPAGTEIGVIELPQYIVGRLSTTLLQARAAKTGWKIVAVHAADLTNLIPDVQKATTDMINANPNLKVIYGCCDFVPVAALPAIRSSGRDIKLYTMDGEPSTIPSINSGGVVAEVAEYQKGTIIAFDQLARYFATGAKIDKSAFKKNPPKIRLIDKGEFNTWLFPTSKMIAPFQAKWRKQYILSK